MASRRQLSPAPNSARYVPALDGLRALSVLAIIAFHAELGSVPGGFVGVEVFFVVSGYLISALLLIEQRATGVISLGTFWLRRARRLLPAQLALLVAALVASLALGPEVLSETRGDGLAALLYVSNWWQVIHHHSYFMAIERPPLLLHLWSLAIEEQFYLFWPLSMALLGRAAPRWLAPLALCGALGSALWMARLFDPALDPTRVYVATDTRLSGLLMGAALAAIVRAPLTPSRPASALANASQEGLALGGLCGLVWAFARFASRDAFVYRGGLVLVDLAACALIVGLVAPTRVARLFGARPVAWLGRRSYGLYLWHWPVFALTRPDQDVALGGLRLLVLRLALTFVSAEICYRYLEMPVRRGELLRVRARPLVFAACAAFAAVLAIGLICATSTRLASARPDTLGSRAATGSSPIAASPPVTANCAPGAGPLAADSGRGVVLDPAWPKTLTLLSDSVALALAKSLPAALPGWKVEVLGRPALMVKQVVPEFLNARSVGSVVVIALAYNSLFERDRRDSQRWNELWDRGAEQLLSDLKACGAKKLIWITLREPSRGLITAAGRDQYRQYAWFFPYVNERIRLLAARHPELAIADWQAISNVPDITDDLIHLNPAGVGLMTRLIAGAVLGPEGAVR